MVDAYLSLVLRPVTAAYDPEKNYTALWQNSAVYDLAVLRISLAASGYPSAYANSVVETLRSGARAPPYIETAVRQCAPPRLLHGIHYRLQQLHDYRLSRMTPHDVVPLTMPTGIHVHHWQGRSGHRR